MKSQTLILFLLLCMSIPSIAQSTSTKKTPASVTDDKASNRRFRGMVIAGFNMSQIDGDRMAGYYKFGFNGGVGVFAMIKKKFSLSMELLYNMKGAKSQLNNAKYNSRSISLDYLDIPVMFNFHDKKIAIFGAGFSVGGLIRKNQVIYDAQGYKQPYLNYKDVNGDNQTVTLDSYNANYRPYDFQVVGHATFLIRKVIGVQARFAYSLVGLGKVSFPDGNLSSGQQRSNVLSLRLFYMI